MSRGQEAPGRRAAGAGRHPQPRRLRPAGAVRAPRGAGPSPTPRGDPLHRQRDRAPRRQSYGATQVRDANRAIMQAVLGRHGFGAVTDLGMARDDITDLRCKLDAGLQRNVLLVSGGVSRGTYNIVPEILAELGVSCLFAGVAVKPGKPLWAGATPTGALVLALPGNPLAVLGHTSELVVPLLRSMCGHPAPVILLLPGHSRGGRAHRG